MESDINKLSAIHSLENLKAKFSINDEIMEENKLEEENNPENNYKHKKNILNTKKVNDFNSDLLKEKRIISLNTDSTNKWLNKKNKRKLIFLVHKRLHSLKIKGKNINLDKTTIYRKHDKNEKDNIITKIQIHYRNFLVEFTNEVIKKIILEECYILKTLDKIGHLKDYLFKKIDHRFKSNTKKDIMKFVESIKIKDIISPSVTLCKKYKIQNRNQQIMQKIESLNNPILNKILNSEYLHYFDLFYNNQRKIILKEGSSSIDLELNRNIKLFDFLIEKHKNDEKYISNLKKCAILNFCKNIIENDD